MRRTTPNVESIPRVHGVLAQAIARLSPQSLDERIRALERFVTDARRKRLRSVIERRVGSVTVLLDSPHDPYNGAAVVRSSDAFGLAYVHVIERRESFLAASAVARGSERWVDVIPHSSGHAAAEALTGHGFELIATHPQGDLEPEDLAAIDKPFALVLGNERDGIAADLHAHTMRSVRIPMFGYAESLNVSVTAAILLFAAMKQRPGDLSELERARLLLRGLMMTYPKAREVLSALDLAVDERAVGQPT